MGNENDRLLFRPGEAAAAIGVSRARAYELIASKTIPSIRIGGSIRVPVSALRAWIDAQLDEQSKAPAEADDLVEHATAAAAAAHRPRPRRGTVTR